MEKKDIFQDIQNIRSSNPVLYWEVEHLFPMAYQEWVF